MRKEEAAQHLQPWLCGCCFLDERRRPDEQPGAVDDVVFDFGAVADVDNRSSLVSTSQTFSQEVRKIVIVPVLVFRVSFIGTDWCILRLGLCLPDQMNLYFVMLV